MTKFIYFIILFCFYSNTIQADTVNSQQTSDSFLYSNTTQAANITFQQMSKSFINEASHYLSTGETYIDTAINDVSNLINSLANLTCETTALLNMYKGDMEHTCTPTPLVSLIVSQILAPNALPVLLRLSMNNSKLLGYDNCAVYKRASYYSPSVTFGMCLNTKLIPNRILPLAEAIGTSITAAFTGGDPAAAFKNINLNALPPDKVYQKYTLNISGTNSEGPTVTLWDIPVGIELTYMPLKLKRYDDRVCVSTTLFDGWTPTEPIGCKYTIDPYEISKYAGFMGESGDKIAQGKQNDPQVYTALQQIGEQMLNCNNLSNCYNYAVKQSKTLLPISAPIINCVQQMINRFISTPTVCGAVNTTVNNSTTSQTNTSYSFTTQSAFYTFQDNMRMAVTALLILYLMFTGAKIFFGSYISKQQIIMFVVKFILVTYFSIGINNKDGGYSYSGMIDLIFPFLFSGVNEIASWIMNAGSSGLCSFTAEDYTGGTNMALWDAIDCRTMTYLGVSGFADLFAWLRQSGQIDTNIDVINYSIPIYFPLLIAGIWTGNVALITLALSFPILVISIAAYVLQSFMVSVIFIAILGTLAVLFVPMALFEYSYQYFEKWMKVLFSFMLQPAVIVTFSVLVFSIYDYGFYGTCKYKPLNVSMPNPMNTTLKTFFIDLNTQDPSCTQTIGWWFADKFDFSAINGNTITLEELVKAQGGISNSIKKVATTIVGGMPQIQIPSDSLISSPITGIGDLFTTAGNFINVIFAPVQGFFQVIGSMLVACFALYIGKETSDQLSNFAAEMTAGVSLKSLTVSPKQSFDTAMKLASLAATKGKSLKGGSSLEQNRNFGDAVTNSSKHQDTITSSPASTSTNDDTHQDSHKTTPPPPEAQTTSASDHKLAETSKPREEISHSAQDSSSAHQEEDGTEEERNRSAQDRTNANSSKIGDGNA